MTASAYTLAAIALERYYAICKPLHSRVWHTRSHAFCVIGVVWLIAIISNLFMLFMYELRTYNRSGLNCAPKYEPVVHFGYQVKSHFHAFNLSIVSDIHDRSFIGDSTGVDDSLIWVCNQLSKVRFKDGYCCY